MNKNLSLAIEKAVEKITPKDNFPIYQNKADKKPDLFSLTSQTELFQNDKGITIKIDRFKDTKWIQKISKKLSLANNIYRFSKLE